MKIYVAQINPTIGDFEGNSSIILSQLENAHKENATIVLFPELALTGYPPEDLLNQRHFLDAVQRHLDALIPATKGLIALIGTPRANPSDRGKHLHNSAAILSDGQLLGYHDKMLLPTYDVFDEQRHFEPGTSLSIWPLAGKNVAITICEDLWEHSRQLTHTTYHRDPVCELEPLKPDLVLNLSASPYCVGRFHDRLNVTSTAAKTLNCPIVLCNQVGGNDSLIFDGYSHVVNAEGALIQHAAPFEEGFFVYDVEQSAESYTLTPNATEDLFHALVLGMKDYFHKLGFHQACLGLSGGIDSALVACIAAEALGPENVLAVGMPSRYTSEAAITDAMEFVHNLKIRYRHITIEPLFEGFLEALQPHFEGHAPDVTEENLQARIRGTILMALSNKLNYIVLSTGNKSEMAMGYFTIYGDTCGGLSIINDVTKQQVYALARWINAEKEIIPQSIIDKAPSAELRPDQKDSDALPEYDIVDRVVQGYVEEYLTPEEIAEKWTLSLDLVQELIHKIHVNEYKRRQSPPGLRVSEKAFSVGRRYPIVQRWVT